MAYTKAEIKMSEIKAKLHFEAKAKPAHSYYVSEGSTMAASQA